MSYIDIVFDGPPSHEPGRFVEVEDESGKSITVGQWVQRNENDGFWALRIPTGTSLNELAQKINDTSTAHGFWPEEGRNFGEMIALAHSELSEALEEHRSGEAAVYYKVSAPAADVELSDEVMAVVEKVKTTQELTNEDIALLRTSGLAKPEGTAVELADCIIRCLDTMYSLGVDIDAVVEAKMTYNDSRPYKHGRAY